MKIGIIVHSRTGNTYSVAGELKEKLTSAGHAVGLEKITALNDDQADAGKVRLNQMPDISTYDALIFAGPVRGFSISPVIKAYLSQTASLKNKKVACFVTEYFPYPWMGGNRAIAQMKSICESKGCQFCGTGIINWSNRRREKMIAETVQRLSSLF